MVQKQAGTMHRPTPLHARLKFDSPATWDQQEVSLIAYSSLGPRHDAKTYSALDALCGANFLSTFWEGDVRLCSRRFRCAEAAYVAMQFPNQASSLEGVDGDDAVDLTALYYSEFGQCDSLFDAWKGMDEVLRCKFQADDLVEGLLATADAYILEHSGICSDDVWSDNEDGTGMNYSGLLLMKIREDLLKQRNKSTVWSSILDAAVDLSDGSRPYATSSWRSIVKAAHAVLKEELTDNGSKAAPVQQQPSMMRDPRDSTKQVGAIAFYFPGAQADCDKLYGHEVFGNFYPCGLQLFEKTFTNAEAAFQALKFWTQVDQFATADGAGAFALKRSLEAGGVLPDRSYHGFGGNWQGMLQVLMSKFDDPHCRRVLLSSGDAFLLEHNSAPGRDSIWSNNNLGDGKNWLGMQLMLLRDDLLLRDGGSCTGWSSFITGICQICKDTGTALDANGAQVWQRAVQDATDTVQRALSLAFPSSAVPAHKQAVAGSKSKTPMCRRCEVRPTFDGQPGYCSRSCRDVAQASRPSSSCKRKLPLCQRCNSHPTHDGKPGGYCSKSCRDAVQQAWSFGGAARVELCQWCGRQPTFNGLPGHCTTTCRDKEAWHRNVQLQMP
mmetsp:Transcript_45520/g.105496  ORF Transcript_45520/g.105496 Transcript_45520/m.105496 type:complete len:609 (+) Transcript_45520:103-1929(+)